MSGVVGLDLSITATGVAHTDGGTETWRGPACLGDKRIKIIRDSLDDVICEQDPELIVIEDLPTHAHGAGITGMVHGAVRCLVLDHGVSYVLVPPASLKRYATSRGNATKSDMRVALLQRAGLDERDDNRVDAWWLRAMGLDHLGRPPLDLPKAHREALDRVEWS